MKELAEIDARYSIVRGIMNSSQKPLFDLVRSRSNTGCLNDEIKVALELSAHVPEAGCSRPS